MEIIRRLQTFNKYRVDIFRDIEIKLANLKWTKYIVLVSATILLVIWAFLSIENFGLIDGLDPSWEMGLSAALDQKQLAGRDTFFSYGPLYQIISSYSSRLNAHNSPYDGNRIARLLVVEISIVLFGICLLLIKPLISLQIILIYFLLWLTGTFQPMSIRVITSLLGVIIYYKALISKDIKSIVCYAAIAGLMAFFAQLLTFEAGVYTIFTIIIVTLFCIFITKIKVLPTCFINTSSYVKMLFVSVFCYIVANIGISTLFKFSSPNYSNLFTYQIRSMEIMSIYSRTLGSPWINWKWGTLAWFFLLAGTFILSIFRIKASKHEESILYICLFCFSGLMLKSSITRAEPLQLIHGTFPMFFTLIVLGKPPMHKKFLFTWFLIVTFFASTWVGSGLHKVFELREILRGNYSLTERWNQLRLADNSKLSPPLNELISRHSNIPLLAFPYQNFIPIVAERIMVAPFLQPYVTGSEHMQKKYISDLSAYTYEFEVIYAIDEITSWRIDGVDSITRMPIIFEYLYQNYQLADTIVTPDGYFILDQRAKATYFQEVPISFTMQENKDEISILFSEPSQCSLLKLNLSINYPIWSIIGHSSPIHVDIYSPFQKIAETNIVSLNANGPFDTFINILSPYDFPKLFDSGMFPVTLVDKIIVSDVEGGIFGTESNSVGIFEIYCIIQ